MIATHVHNNTGNAYMYLFETNIAATKEGWIRQVIYLDECGNLWSRPTTEFNEKFTRIDE